MAEIDAEKLKKLLRGERIGTVALIACTAIFICFIVCFTVTQTMDLQTLRLASLIAAPILLVAAVSVAAYCNIKFGGAIDKLIGKYVVAVFVENAALVHPERDSLNFYITQNGAKIELTVNGYKEKLVFDFSAFGKLSPMRKLAVFSEIEKRLSDTFCRLVIERGAKYTSVCYTERASGKKSKMIPVITNGTPDKKAAKNYYKNRQN